VVLSIIVSLNNEGVKKIFVRLFELGVNGLYPRFSKAKMAENQAYSGIGSI
jgi:hypothetical protein